MIILIVLTTLTFIMVARTILIVGGAYKDPMLASFEQYGEERIFSPLVSLVVWSALFAYIMLYWYIPSTMAFAIGLMIIIPVGSLYGLFLRLIHRYRHILQKYPRWCYELIQNTDREERRRIAYMWLFLPPSTRMIYNTNNHLFRQWVEQVIVTVAQ